MKKRKAVNQNAPAGLEDERFVHLKSDPKFSTLSNKNKKVVIEKRFAAVLTDSKFSTRAPVDKRGRRLHKTTGNDLLDLYEVEQGSDKESEKNPVKRARLEKASKNETVQKAPVKLDLARGEGNISSSDESDSDSEWDLPESLQKEMDFSQLDQDVEKVEWASRRLAACNLDWKIVKAEDIMILVNSFKPPGGSIEKVSIYLSDFGKQRLEEEDKYGPQLKISKSIEDIPEAEELEPEVKAAVRKYQIDLLKYYYAVIECDSEKTATVVYEQCDGFQFETSGLKMDLRFVPDDMEFENARLKEQITEDDVNFEKYKSKEKIRSGVAQTDGKVAWDENDEERTKKFQEAFNDDNEGGGLIADSDSDDDEAAENRRQVLRALLDEGERDEELDVEWSDEEQKKIKPISEDIKEEVVDSDVQEESDGSESIEKALAKRDGGVDSEGEEDEEEEVYDGKKSENKKSSNYQSYLEKRKQKRKERKQKLKEAKEAERETLNDVEKDAKIRQKVVKGKKAVPSADEELIEKVVADNRFKALFTDSAFAIEQSAKQFKGSKLIEKQASVKKENKTQQNVSDDLLTKLKEKAGKWQQKKQQKKK